MSERYTICVPVDDLRRWLTAAYDRGAEAAKLRETPSAFDHYGAERDQFVTTLMRQIDANHPEQPIWTSLVNIDESVQLLQEMSEQPVGDRNRMRTVVGVITNAVNVLRRALRPQYSTMTPEREAEIKVWLDEQIDPETVERIAALQEVDPE